MPQVNTFEGVKRGTCWKSEELAFPIELKQNGIDNFTVIYGKQVDANLTYARAASKLGEAIMHALACESKLDNRERGER